MRKIHSRSDQTKISSVRHSPHRMKRLKSFHQKKWSKSDTSVPTTSGQTVSETWSLEPSRLPLRRSIGMQIAIKNNLVLNTITNQSESSEHLLGNRTMCFIAADAGLPDTFEAMRIMTKMRDYGVTGFIGFEHSCAREAMLAAAWDLPLISYVSTISSNPMRNWHELKPMLNLQNLECLLIRCPTVHESVISFVFIG